MGAPNIKPLLVCAAEAHFACDVDAVDSKLGNLDDKTAEGELVEVGEPTTVAHVVASAQLEVKVDSSTGHKGVCVLRDDVRNLHGWHIKQAAASPDAVIEAFGLVIGKKSM